MYDPTQDALGRIVRRLVERYRPEKIILFGSYASGQPDRDSDIDLLIIKDTSETLCARLDAVRKAVAGAHPRIPFDPLVLTPGEMRLRVKAGDQFLNDILAKGKVLHEE